MPQYKVMFSRFPYGNSECSESTDWLVQTVHKAKTDPRISEVIGKKYNTTPVTMARNRAAKHAKELGCDYLCMIDSDQAPDLDYPNATPFWDTAFNFALQHRDKPCILAAPYSGPPPLEAPYAFHWTNQQSDNPNCDFALTMMTRAETACRAGIEEVAAMPTGLILIDTRVFDILQPPFFYYEYKDAPFDSELASTEDVVFTRNASLAGIPVYALWSSWAGHNKNKLVGKPELLTVDSIRSCFKEAVERNQRSDEKLVHVGTGKNGRNGRSRYEAVQTMRNLEAENAAVLLQEGGVQGRSPVFVHTVLGQEPEGAQKQGRLQEGT